MATRAFPVIYSRNVGQLEQFYAQFGFQEVFRLPPDGEPGYVSLKRGDSELGIVSGEFPRDQFGGEVGTGIRFEMYVYVDDIDATISTLGAKVLKQPEDMPWGERLAYVQDPDGNPVALCRAAAG